MLGNLRRLWDRGRRKLRRAILEPILVGNRSFRETVLNALAARGHLIYARCADAVFYVDPSDRTVGTELVWGRGEWAKAETDLAIALLKAANRLRPGSAFVDIGGNIGTQTIYALKSGAFARAIAFEPEPRNAELLRMNIAANGYSGRATVVEKAIGDSQGVATLYLHPRNRGNHMIGKAPSSDVMEHVSVAIARGDTELDLAGLSPDGVGLCWIDVEGLEPQVVQGLGRYAAAAVPLAIEWSPRRYTAADRDALVQLLVKHYTMMHWLQGEKVNAPAEPVSGIAGITEGYTDILIY